MTKADVTPNHVLSESLFTAALPPRDTAANKGSFGSLAIIGGDTGMVGAVLLAARAALHCGVGRTYAAILCEQAPAVDFLHPELMLRSVAEIANLPQLNALVIGPGLGQSDRAIDLLQFWLGQQIALLLDADALNLIAKHPQLVKLVQQRDAETVITPHPGEAARLLATTVETIQNNRTESARTLAQHFKATCVLKGASTVCAHHDGSWFVNSSGNVGLATGGTGDVLSGMIGSLIAQGLNGLAAAKLGVYVHGAAADMLVKKGIGPIGMTASEVIIEARNLLNQLGKTPN
jgi:ADP-dependent NAD(P)H-hydrate dehydratase / NAD(P)H-hydrate epimerase